tara:strand:+ start:9076 stop:9477 length:402 start_codon:yes stop_codon:yes gene_type:complete
MKYINNSNVNINKIIANKTCYIGIFSKNCIHCQNMKPAWNVFKNKIKKLNNDSYLIEIYGDNINKLKSDYLKNHIMFTGVPSFIKFKNGKIIKEYKGDRSVKSLLNFIDKKGSKTIKKRDKNKQTKKKRINFF